MTPTPGTDQCGADGDPGPDRRLAVCISHSPGMARDTEQAEGHAFRAGMASVREAVETFAPDLTVLFGTDHWRGFSDIVPAVGVVVEAEAIGDLGSPTGTYRIPRERAMHVASGLLDANVDCAVIRRGRLDHGFGQTVANVLGGLGQYPILPIFLNCALPPLMSCARAVEIGRRIRTVLGDEGRVLFLASGGLSHDPPSLATDAYGLDDAARRERNVSGARAAAGRIRPDLDERLLESLAETEDHWVPSLHDWYLPYAGVGGNEVRTWLACWAAGGGGLRRIAYEVVPEWITGMGVASSAWAMR